jgi:ADP-heptose:LPS heptosyltransferase
VRLVVLRALGLGDLLTAAPALRALARAFPDHRRLLAAPRRLAPLVDLLGGAVDEVVHAEPLAPLADELNSPDVAVNLHGRGPESHRVLLAASPRRLIALHNREVPESSGMPLWVAGEHEVERWCRLLRESGIPADPSDLSLAPPPDPVPAFVRHATLIHPGAASEARRWPPERFAEVARAEQRRGRPVVLTGAAAERDLAERIATAAGLPPGCVLAGRTSLRELAAVVAAAGRVLCGDTGVAHLATALGTPSVLLFGPTSPGEWGPRGGPHAVLWSGGSGDAHAGRPDPGLLRIEPAAVIRALEEPAGVTPR